MPHPHRIDNSDAKPFGSLKRDPIKFKTPAHAQILGKRQDAVGELRTDRENRAYLNEVRKPASQPRLGSAKLICGEAPESVTWLSQINVMHAHIFHQAGQISAVHIVVTKNRVSGGTFVGHEAVQKIK